MAVSTSANRICPVTCEEKWLKRKIVMRRTAVLLENGSGAGIH